MRKTFIEFGESSALIRKRGRTAMFLLRELSVPRTTLNSPGVCLMLLALLAQSCAAISDPSRRNDPSLIGNENTPGDADIQKASIESDGQISEAPRQAYSSGRPRGTDRDSTARKPQVERSMIRPSLLPRTENLPLGSKARVTNWTMEAALWWRSMIAVPSLTVGLSMCRRQRPEPWVS